MNLTEEQLCLVWGVLEQAHKDLGMSDSLEFGADFIEIIDIIKKEVKK